MKCRSRLLICTSQSIPKTVEKLEFGKTAAQIFFLERATIVRVQGASEEQKICSKANAAKFPLFNRFWYNNKWEFEISTTPKFPYVPRSSRFKHFYSVLKQWGFVFLFFCFSYFISVIECRNISRKILDEISLKEAEELKLLFYYLFADHELGYTLLGDKPMTFCLAPTCYMAISTKEQFFKIYYHNCIDLRNALVLLKKLQDSKINSNYIFVVTEKNERPDYVFFINRARFIEVFNQNICAFKRVFGHKITAESCLKAFQNQSIDINELFEEHELLGIMFGYGRHNAKLFERRHVLVHGRKKIPYTLHPKPSASFSTVEEELCFLNQHLKLVNSNQLGLLKLDPINFAADSDSVETKQLCKHYSSIRLKLTKLFSNDNWFELILEKLCAND